MVKPKFLNFRIFPVHPFGKKRWSKRSERSERSAAERDSCSNAPAQSRETGCGIAFPSPAHIFPVDNATILAHISFQTGSGNAIPQPVAFQCREFAMTQLAKLRTFTARAIISDALLERRDEFNATLRARIASDRTYFDALHPESVRTRQGVRASIWAAEKVQCWSDLGDIDALVSECGPMVIALNIACKVLDISAAKRTAMAVDWEEGKR